VADWKKKKKKEKRNAVLHRHANLGLDRREARSIADVP